MIYPSYQKLNACEWIEFTPQNVLINGFENEYASEILGTNNGENCKADILYIDIIKKNTKDTEYIDECCRVTDEKYFISSKKCDNGLHITVTVSCRKSLFRALCRIKGMINDKKFFIGNAEDYPLFAERGYIEGFYGNPWSFENRKMMIELLSFYGMNTHYYAPKDDPYHRDKWDELYPGKELSELSVMLEICNKNFVDFYYCIAPGLSMQYSSEEDFEKLISKAEQLYSIGIRNFGLLVDDIPENLYFEQDKITFDGDAVNAHIYLCNKFYARLKALSPECKLTVCPLQYHGNGDEYYISKLGKGLAGGIKLFWTGKNICSQEISVREAVIFEYSTNRKPLYWDNFPVNDAEMYNEMHIGYLNGREKDLYRYSEGIISNTMEYTLSSRIPLLTVCDYLWNPVEYNGFESWHKACEIILGGDKETVMPFLDNLLTSCLKVENSPMLNVCLNDAQQKYFDGDIDGAKAILFEYITKLEKCCRYLETVDNPMFSELSTWAEKQKIALELIKSSASILDDNSEENKAVARNLLNKYLIHPRTLCDFSLQAFAERMLTL
ncbi:MAG: protein O-GlcNAcase [Acutalibacteraceae bacterium]|nr:protein O-GlcNAcase [Acutalibacteraceae bacterium]